MATANQPPQTTITITGSPTNSKSKNLNKKENKKKKKLKIFNKHCRPTIATNIAGPKLNQPPPQPWHHHWPKIPTQPINHWLKTHTSKPTTATNTAAHYSHKHLRPKTQPTTGTTTTPPPAQNPNLTNQSMTQNPHIETHPKYHTHEPIKRSKG